MHRFFLTRFAAVRAGIPDSPRRQNGSAPGMDFLIAAGGSRSHVRFPVGQVPGHQLKTVLRHPRTSSGSGVIGSGLSSSQATQSGSLPGSVVDHRNCGEPTLCSPRAICGQPECVAMGLKGKYDVHPEAAKDPAQRTCLPQFLRVCRACFSTADSIASR